MFWEKRPPVYKVLVGTEKVAGAGTSLVAPWLRLLASPAGGMGSIPGWGTKIPTYHMVWPEKHKTSIRCIC